jgi:hypothetical protein
MLHICIIVCILLVAVSTNAQQAGASQNLRKGGRRKPRTFPNTVQANSFTVAYPMAILSDTDSRSVEKNWRTPGYKCNDLVSDSDNGKPYAYLAKAQDQEDIWLYENWFYGMRGIEYCFFYCLLFSFLKMFLYTV